MCAPQEDAYPPHPPYTHSDALQQDAGFQKESACSGGTVLSVYTVEAEGAMVVHSWWTPSLSPGFQWAAGLSKTDRQAAVLTLFCKKGSVCVGSRGVMQGLESPDQDLSCTLCVVYPVPSEWWGAPEGWTRDTASDLYFSGPSGYCVRNLWPLCGEGVDGFLEAS